MVAIRAALLRVRHTESVRDEVTPATPAPEFINHSAAYRSDSVGVPRRPGNPRRERRNGSGRQPPESGVNATGRRRSAAIIEFVRQSTDR